jgi:hypothetical protein
MSDDEAIRCIKKDRWFVCSGEPTLNPRLMADADRKFSDEEFALILRKASELQDGSAVVEGVSGGISLDEIKAIAQEVGIDPAAVDRVATMMPHAESEGAISRLMGGPTKYRLEHTAEGRIGEADVARLLDAVRRASGHHGKVEYGPQGFEWSTVGEVSQIYATAVPGKEGTHIRVTADRGPASFLTFFFNFLGWMVAAGITGAVIDPESVAVGAAIFSGGVLGGIAQGRMVWAKTTKSIRAKLHRIMEPLTGAAEEVGQKELTD